MLRLYDACLIKIICIYIKKKKNQVLNYTIKLIGSQKKKNYKLNKKYFKYRIKRLSYKPFIKAFIPTNMNQ